MEHFRYSESHEGISPNIETLCALLSEHKQTEAENARLDTELRQVKTALTSSQQRNEDLLRESEEECARVEQELSEQRAEVSRLQSELRDVATSCEQLRRKCDAAETSQETLTQQVRGDFSCMHIKSFQYFTYVGIFQLSDVSTEVAVLQAEKTDLEERVKDAAAQTQVSIGSEIASVAHALLSSCVFSLQELERKLRVEQKQSGEFLSQFVAFENKIAQLQHERDKLTAQVTSQDGSMKMLAVQLDEKSKSLQQLRETQAQRGADEQQVSGRRHTCTYTGWFPWNHGDVVSVAE